MTKNPKIMTIATACTQVFETIRVRGALGSVVGWSCWVPRHAMTMSPRCRSRVPSGSVPAGSTSNRD